MGSLVVCLRGAVVQPVHIELVLAETRGQPENVMEQAERHSELKMSQEVWISVAQCGPRMDRKARIGRGVESTDTLVLQRFSRVERVTGIEPAVSAWEPT